MNKIEMPMGLGMALAQNEAAMTKFAALSESDKQKIIDGTHFDESKSEMKQYVIKNYC